MQLFIDRALAVQPAFEVSEANAPAVAGICHHLDGIPLAIELAAARLRSLSVEEVYVRLDQRFRLLTGGSRTALPRQQTLRSAIDWSYDLLSGVEQLLLGRLSVFAGGWTLKAAEQVCAGEPVDQSEMLDHLTSLADKSLVVADEHDRATRYRLLETVREYARGKLIESGEEDRCQRRHLTYFVALAEEAEPQLMDADQRAWLERLETEHDNLHAALARSSAAGEVAEEGLRLMGALYRFWSVRGYLDEGRRWLAKLLATEPDGPPESRAKALAGAGGLALQQGDYEAARSYFEHSLAIWREIGNRKGIASTLANLGVVAFDQGDLSAAREQLEASLAIQRESSDKRGIAGSLNNLANVVCDQGDYAAARALHDECLAIRRELGDRRGIAMSLHNLAAISHAHDDFRSVRTLQEESLAIFRELGDRRAIAAALEGLADVAFTENEPDRAARVWGAAERLREEIGAPLAPSERPRYHRQVTAARAASGDGAAFDRAWQDGRAMTLDRAVECAVGERQA